MIQENPKLQEDDQVAQVVMCMNSGGKPAGILAGITSALLRKGKEEGIELKKRTAGGLAGMLSHEEAL